ncbi:MAG: GNAT family N-acetyltransferase [Planctomycetes bacterium]|nr:GNAT family N-acetyltransferase [Planctomycetota bacterium]
MTNEIPSLDTERLTLRGHRVADFADSFAMWANPEVTRFIGGKPFSEADCWARVLRHVGHWSLLGFGCWVARDKASGRFVGEVGFMNLKREIEPAFHGTPEIGWALDPWAHGRGLATEAVRAVLAWGDARFGDARTVCLVDPGNEPSLRVAAKCGYAEFGRTTYKGDPVVLFERRGATSAREVAGRSGRA